MSIRDNAVSFIRSIFRREAKAREDASAGFSPGEFTYDMYGNYSLHTLGYNTLADQLQVDTQLMARYVDYERMDEYAECSSALSIYSDDSTVMDPQKKHVCWVECKDAQIQDTLNQMLWKKLDVDGEAWEIIRQLCKYGNCQKFDTRVPTDKGLIEIQHIQPGARVLGHSQKGELVWTRVVRKWDNGIKPVYRVRTKHREIFLTAEHRVLVEESDGTKAWTQVRDLKCERYPSGSLKTTNSRLVIGTRLNEGRVPSWDELWAKDPLGAGSRVWNTKHVVLPDNPTPEFCRWFGFMIGDGWTTSNGTVEWARKPDKEVNDRWCSFAQSLGLEAKEGDGRYIVRAVLLARLVEAIGFTNGSSVKRIPKWMFVLPFEHRKEFLQGFMDADGWVSQPKSRLGFAYHFEVSNYALARDLKALIDGLGFRSGKLRGRKREPGFKIKGKVVKSTLPSFILTFDFTSMDGPFLSEKVVSVDLDGEHQVFDIEVEDENHSFIADGVVVHNSSDEILVDDKGVQGLNFIPSPTLRRIEDKTGMTKAFIQSFRGHFSVPTQTFGDIEFEKGVGKDQGTGVVIFEPWRVVHMRLRAQRRRAQYGLGLLESARHIWKRLILLEDAALIGRLSRAPSRFAFYVDVGRMAPQQAEKYMEATRQQFKKQKFVNPKTGQLDLKFSPLSIDNDLFLPVRDSKEVVRADVLNTPQWTGVEDIEYFRSKLFAALLVPKSYLGYDENLPGRSTLSAEDVRFARSVLRIQREFRKGMRQICDVHLAAIGIDPAYVDYDVKMTIPSSIFELAQLEVQNTRAQFAQQMRELVSEHWILSTIFGLSDEEIKIIYEQKKQEMKDRMGMEGEGGGGGGRFEGREPSRVITPTDIEQRLFNGNRDHEKRLEKDMERVLAENQHLSSQLGELRGLLNDVRSAVRYTNGSSHKGAFGM